jgi:hypothetical protein
MPDATGIPATADPPGAPVPQVGDPDVDGADEEPGGHRRPRRSPKSDVPTGAEEEDAPDGGG